MTSTVIHAEFANVLHKARACRLERYTQTNEFLRLLEAAGNGAEFRRRGGMPMLFGGTEYGTADWLTRWLTSEKAEATGRILLDFIESAESDRPFEILVAVLSTGCTVLCL